MNNLIDNNPLNNVDVDNIREKTNMDPDNIFESTVMDPDNLYEYPPLRSDENYDNYSSLIGKKNKKIKKKTNKVGIIATFSLTAIVGGNMLLNSFFGKQPTVNNFVLNVSFENISYSFDITNSSNIKVFVTIVNDKEELFFEKDVSTSGHYKDDVYLKEGTYTFNLDWTNRFDYKKSIKKETFTVKEEKQ